MAEVSEARIGIALSGGGSRAIAFHLGCLRALEQAGVLRRAKVLSSVSGGSVIAGIYALHDGTFEEFDDRIRKLLSRGLVTAALRAAVLTPEGLKAMACLLSLVCAAIGRILLRRPGRAEPRLKRFASRTTILRRGLDREVFAGANMTETQKPNRPKWIAVATELRTGSAFYFSANFVGSWRFGRAPAHGVSVADAVSASAAFPLLLPALDETLTFEQPDGTTRSARVSLTDGGVYDNLGLAPLWPDRDPKFSLQVEDVDTLIACRAGDGPRFDAPRFFFVGRMWATFAALHERAQNATMKRLFDLQSAGRLKGFLIPYLGQDDERLKSPPPDLVPRSEVINYPTNFSPMPSDWIDRLVRRGEQVTLAVIREHAADWLPVDMDGTD